MNCLPMLLFAIMTFAMTGCLKTDPTGSQPDTQEPALEDNDLRAGSSSSTNWPTKSGDPDSSDQITVNVSVDSTMKIFFTYPLTVSIELGSSTLNQQPPPAKVAGEMSFSKFGVIPVFSAPQSISEKFGETDTIRVSPALLDSLVEKNRDTLYFNIQISSDTLHAWLFGLGYIKSSKRFFRTITAATPVNSTALKPTGKFFEGRFDSADGLFQPYPTGTTKVYFYVPGTDFFWKARPDSGVYGPIPDGVYPLRLLRVTSGGASSGDTEVDVFEVNSISRPDSTKNYSNVFLLGAQVLSKHLKGVVDPRPGG
jgi:hypothetical protein